MISLNVEIVREGTGRPVVLLHGWLGTHRDFLPMLESDAFALGDRPVLAVDLPAHGESEDFDAEWSFDDAAEAVLLAVSEVCDPTDGQAIDLVGYSMGGRLALYIAATRGHRVHRLVLIGAHPGLEHPQDQRDRREVDSDRAVALVDQPTEFLKEWAKLDLFGPATSDGWKAVRERRADKADDRAFGWSRALVSLSLGRQPVLWMAPLAAEIPTLYVVGSRDEKYAELAQTLKQLNGELVDVALVVNAHHAPHLDRPATVARRVAGFLKE